jgi:hypothetical protein
MELEFSSRLYEIEADLAYSRQAEIEEAARWCKANYPHKFQFLNEIYLLLVAEERHFARLGLTQALASGAVKLSPVLALLTPSQALRLLECFKRAVADNPKVWRAKNIWDIDKIQADQKLGQTIASIRQELRQRRRDPQSRPQD